MPKRSSKRKPGPKDLNELAARIVGEATGEPDEPEPTGSALTQAGDKKNGGGRKKR